MIIKIKTLAIGSGKGGVGKTTFAVNSAVALAKQGFKVGLLDADIYGPSVPIMMGLRQMSPRSQIDSSGKEKIIPFTKFGVQVISIGFFMEETQSALWRGPVLFTTLEKIITQVEWGELDYLIIDLPPGTGDILISLSQLLQVDGGIVISTPQEVALLDAMKAINAFDKLEIPIVGIVENMSDEIYPIFGKGKVKEFAKRIGSSHLGSIPLDPLIRIGSDEGRPAALHEENVFEEVVRNIVKENSYA